MYIVSLFVYGVCVCSRSICMFFDYACVMQFQVLVTLCGHCRGRCSCVCAFVYRQTGLFFVFSGSVQIDNCMCAYVCDELCVVF